MARVYVLQQPTPLLAQLYVVDRGVGDGLPNQRDDVLLVQFFLRALMPPKGSYADQEVHQPAGQTPLAIDGVWGPQTRAYVKAFQTQFNEALGSEIQPQFRLRQDGAVNALEGSSVFGKRFHQVMTIVRLNTEYSHFFSLERHKQLHRDPLFPRELFGAFYLPPSG